VLALSRPNSFRVLRMLQDNPDMTQREIVEKLGISTSGLNYCLKALIDKGWVKVQNFSQSINKFGYTPELLAQTDARMLRELNLRSYFKYIFLTVLGKGSGDGVKK